MIEIQDVQEAELPYNYLFQEMIDAYRTCQEEASEDWSASLFLYDLDQRQPLAGMGLDKQMPVASAFKGPVLFYALSHLDPDVTGSVPIRYWSQTGEIPEEYLPLLREHWILSRLYNMIVHSSNRATAQVLNYVNARSQTDLNPLEQFNAWSREVVQTSMESGLYQWQHPPLEGITDPSSPPQNVYGRCGSAYYYYNTYSVRDLGMYYAWLVNEAPAHVQELAFSLLSIVEEEPGFLETTAVRLRGRSISKGGIFGGEAITHVWVDAGLILLEEGQTYLAATATINSADLLSSFYEGIERIIRIENDLPRTHLINQITLPDWAANLKAVASNYQADSHQEAVEVARDIDYIKGHDTEDSSTMCGPLTGAMLRDAGLLAPDVDLGLFWYPDPIRNGRPWTLFDLDDFYLFGFRSPEYALDTFDFTRFPLLPGDIIYTHGGSGTHLFVVTEVDDQGRAYTVTNYCEGEHDCPIRRLLLYDPADPGRGAFYSEFQEGWFRTGMMGFDLLRSKTYPQIFSDWYLTFLLNDEYQEE